ncbi:MAG: hypothetical protein PHC51_09620 [bacterium]|nr:hypothetical protein [bacterium]
MRHKASVAVLLFTSCSVTVVYSEDGIVGDNPYLDTSSSIAVTQFEEATSTVASPEGQDVVPREMTGPQFETLKEPMDEHFPLTTAADIDPVKEDKSDRSLSVYSLPDRGESTIRLDKLKQHSTVINENNQVEYLIGKSDDEVSDGPMYGKFGRYLRYGNKTFDNRHK